MNYPIAPKVHGRSAQGKRAKHAPPWVIMTTIQCTLKACGNDWQEGYGAYSVGRSLRETLVDYIRDQQLRHARLSFQDELHKSHKNYEIEFDEQHLWD